MSLSIAYLLFLILISASPLDVWAAKSGSQQCFGKKCSKKSLSKATIAGIVVACVVVLIVVAIVAWIYLRRRRSKPKYLDNEANTAPSLANIPYDPPTGPPPGLAAAAPNSK